MKTLKISLDFESPFHIGGGVSGESALLKPLLKDALGRPYVPGSAFKGVLRHEAERLVRALVGEDAVCRPPQPETMCPQAPQYGKFCPVCRVFGSPALPATWHFSDLHAEDEVLIKTTTLRYGVGISRYRQAAANDILYATETAERSPFLTFKGKITAATSSTMRDRSSSSEQRGEVALLWAALKALKMLGGGRSRGLGWLHVEVEGVALEPEQIKEEVRTWLKNSPWQ